MLAELALKAIGLVNGTIMALQQCRGVELQKSRRASYWHSVVTGNRRAMDRSYSPSYSRIGEWNRPSPPPRDIRHDIDARYTGSVPCAARAPILELAGA